MHIPVLLEEVIEYLGIGPGSQVFDATLDGGGHTREIVKRFPGVRVVGIEFDPDEAAELKAHDPELVAQITLVNDSYAQIERIAAEHQLVPDAILFDLGVSSWHYESSGRGFSFQHDEPLDMRFNPQVQPTTAAQIINTWSEDDLERILADLGEEQFAKDIANRIVHERRAKPIMTTMELMPVILAATPTWYQHRKLNPATKTFQALRMAVNDELETIRTGLQAAINVLKPGGRLAVISFHGLEDKTVRQVFKEAAAAGTVKWVTKETIKPAWAETRANPRARSAKMKIIEKV